MLKNVLLLIAHLIGILGLVTLSHSPRGLVRIPKELSIFTFRFRNLLMFTGFLTFLSAIVLDQFKTRKPLTNKARLLHAGLLGSSMFAGYVAPANLLFRSKQTNARFISNQEADLYIKDDEEVLVVEVNGDARAYPHKWIIQPHIAGDTVGGEDIVVTYCSLSHLGRAFLATRDLDLSVGTQYGNNLVLFDKSTNKTLQQIDGRFNDGSRLEEVATRFMSWLTFKQLYRTGKVFYYPPNNVFDFVVRALMLDFANRQYKNNQPQFPLAAQTIDRRLSNKEQVYGVEAGGEAKAFRADFLKWMRAPYNTTIGGIPIVISYSTEHDLVDAFYRTIDGKVVDVTSIDAHGNTPDGQLRRFPMASRVLWMVWSGFYPDSALFTNAMSKREAS